MGAVVNAFSSFFGRGLAYNNFRRSFFGNRAVNGRRQLLVGGNW